MPEQYASGLVGKVFEHEWKDGAYTGVVYRVEFLSETELRWTGLAGFPEGRSDVQQYRLAQVGSDIYQFSWRATDGVAVTITYNLDDNKAFGVVLSDEQHVLSGSVWEVERGTT